MRPSRVHRLVVPTRLWVFRGALGATLCFGVALGIQACSSSSSAVGPGGECFLATDCAPGLVCVEQANHTRSCTNDLSRIAGDVPPDGGGAEENDAATDGAAADSAQPDTGGGTPDTGTPDTGGGTPDTGAPPVDSGGD